MTTTTVQEDMTLVASLLALMTECEKHLEQCEKHFPTDVLMNKGYDEAHTHLRWALTKVTERIFHAV